MPSMPSSEGLILDATALIDFVGLGVGMATTAVQPSFISQEVLDSDRLEESTRSAATQYLKPLPRYRRDVLSFIELG